MGIPWGIRPNPSSTSPWTFETSRSSSNKERKGWRSATRHRVFQEPLERAEDSHPLGGVHVGADHHFVAELAVSAAADFHGPDLHAGKRHREQVPSERRQPGDHRGREEVAPHDGRDKISQREDLRIERPPLGKLVPGVVHHRPGRAQPGQPVPARRRSLRSDLQSVHRQGQAQQRGGNRGAAAQGRPLLGFREEPHGHASAIQREVKGDPQHDFLPADLVGVEPGQDGPRDGRKADRLHAIFSKVFRFNSN